MYVVIANTDTDYYMIDTQLGELKYLDESSLISLLKCGAVKIENFNRRGYTQGNVNDLPDTDEVQKGEERYFVLKKNEKFGKDSYTVVSNYVFTETEMSLKQINKLYLDGQLVNAKVELEDGEQVVRLKRGELPVHISIEKKEKQEPVLLKKAEMKDDWFNEEEDNIQIEEVYTSNVEPVVQEGLDTEDISDESVKKEDGKEEETESSVKEEEEIIEDKIPGDVFDEGIIDSADGIEGQEASEGLENIEQEDDFDYSGLEDIEIDLYGADEPVKLDDKVEGKTETVIDENIQQLDAEEDKVTKKEVEVEVSSETEEAKREDLKLNEFDEESNPDLQEDYAIEWTETSEINENTILSESVGADIDSMVESDGSSEKELDNQVEESLSTPEVAIEETIDTEALEELEVKQEDTTAVETPSNKDEDEEGLPILTEKYLRELIRKENKKQKVAVNEESKGQARKYIIANRKKSVKELLVELKGKDIGLTEKELEVLILHGNGIFAEKIEQSVLFASLCYTLGITLDVCGMINDN